MKTPRAWSLERGCLESDAAAIQQDAIENREPCRWDGRTLMDMWKTECGQLFHVAFGPPVSKFCGGCGRRIEVAK